SATSSVALMCARTEGFSSLYVVGMIICFLAISTLEIFRPSALLGWLLAMTVAYVMINALVAQTLDWPHAVASTSFLVGAVLFCGVSAVLTDQHRYNLFLAHRELLLRNVELQRAREQQANFLSTVSHELRSPVNSMLGFCELVEQRERELQAKSRANLARVRESGQRLLGLINDLLDLSKAESGLMELRPTTFDLMTVVGEVAEATRALVLHRALDVIVVGPESLMVHSDEMRVRQILTNLATNAAKFTEHGNVTLSVSTEHGVTLAVSDTGQGIPVEARNIIFEAFRQLGVSAGGTGLGLCIVKHMVELLQGSIELESELGRGSTFRVHLGAIEARVAA
ncbi:MAG TPA: HAMP domain-containing sensor histidine kinase, partial [Polyangiaceae bacterium]|nr:HAMP domain-containing sensor histidine kinase [Polyangiaceae bacterium]